MSVGLLLGLAHAVYVYRRHASDFPQALAASPVSTRLRALYFAAWTVGLWALFGIYVLVLWLVAVPAYLLYRGHRKPPSPKVAAPARSIASDARFAPLEPVRRVAVIGAGVSGLATARALQGDGIECTLFERGERLGGVWADGYAGFGVQVQRELYEFPDDPLPDDVPDFTPGPVLQAYLQRYAKRHAIDGRIRFGTEVRDVARVAGGGGWRIEWSSAQGVGSDVFDFVVVAIGVYSQAPHAPAFPGQQGFAGEVLHVSQVRSRELLEGRKVLIVGYGKSATDIALESAAVARRTAIAIRTPHWPVPSRLAGILPFKWGLLNRLSSSVIPLYLRPSTPERVAHSLGRPLVWLYWRLVEGLLIVQHGLHSGRGARPSLVPDEPLEVGGFDEATMLPRPAFQRALRGGAIEPHRATISAFEADAVRLSDGSRLDVDTVVLATGWKTDFAFLSEDVRSDLVASDDGLYLYRHVLHPDVPGLAFVGRATTVVSILTYSLQARWLAEWLSGRMSLPGPAAMHREIENLAAWKRSWIPFSGARSARLILHMQHYHDELLRDIGANPLRKRGLLAPLKELFAPYEPSDYTAIVTGEWRREPLRRSVACGEEAPRSR